MIKYVLVDKPLMTGLGTFHHTKVTLEQVSDVLKEGNYAAAIENPVTKSYVEDLLGTLSISNCALGVQNRSVQHICFEFADSLDMFLTRRELADNCRISLITLI